MDTGSDQYFDPLKFARVISNLEKRIADEGYQVRYGADFAELERSLSETDKNQLTEHFRTALNTYTPANAFWVTVSDGLDLVAVEAARFDDLGAENLAEHLRKYWRRCYPDKVDGRAEAAQTQPRFLGEMCGRVAYIGDLWVARAYQRRRLHEALSPLTMFIALQRWRPDWLYAWIRPSHWAKRYPLAYGFSAVHPRGIQWVTEPATIDPDLVMAVNSRNWALDWLDHQSDVLLAASHTR